MEEDKENEDFYWILEVTENRYARILESFVKKASMLNEKEEFKESLNLTSQFFSFNYSTHLMKLIDKNVILIEAMISYYVESIQNVILNPLEKVKYLDKVKYLEKNKRLKFYIET